MSSESEEKVSSDLEITEKALVDGVQHLIHWLTKQPHLPNFEDEQLLKSFIMGSKSVEKAKERLDRYFTAKSKNPELFGIRDPDSIEWPKVEKMMLLPGKTPEGYQVLFLKEPYEKEQIEAFSFIETARAGFMFLDIILRSNPTSAGQILVVDCKSHCSDLLVKFVTSHTPAIFNIYQQALPVRMKGLICINASTFIETFCNNVLKLFFSEKLQERISVHSGDHTVLEKYFPLDMLPEDYGGKSPSIEKLFEETKETLKKNRDWLMKEGSVGADETLRPKSDLHPEELQGTFTKLQID